MRQLLESDRKLRTLSLVKYSRISFSYIDQVAKSTTNVENEVIAKAESLYEDLQFSILPADNDVVVIFYVTGYTAANLWSPEINAQNAKTPPSLVLMEQRMTFLTVPTKFIKDIDRGEL